ncbi:twin transmembrane helix small protein [Falsiphaeobacter marinintestinus]|uniref:twin transmembrane helix small protein n=1 Tax=Falsiphaeobacter marinintestinus TaxID=1492905 RepID=UPI0011B6218F|nr:twin transmembrane helix small protein [Phaeobacter marinintestinus]
MGQVLFIAMIVAMCAVVIVLMLGIGGFAKGGKFNAKYGNKMMQLRILLQAVAIALILLFVYLRGQGAFN